MVSSPGRMQSAFTAGELAEILEERTTLKYFATGLKYAENIVIAPQGGFRLRDGLRLIGDLPADADRLFTFDASNGNHFDLVLAGESCHVWNATSVEATITVQGMSQFVSELTSAQRLDTLLLFHSELQTKRVIYTPNGWQVGDLPYEEIPNYDYGETYTNGVPAEWTLEFVGLSSGSAIAGSVFRLEIAKGTGSAYATGNIAYTDDNAAMAARLASAIGAVISVGAGISVTNTAPNRFRVEFSGASNVSAHWTVVSPISNPGEINTTKLQDGDGSSTPDVWQIELDQLSAPSTSGGSIFVITVSGQETASIAYTSNATVLRNTIAAAIDNLPNVALGTTVTIPSANIISIKFTGANNEGDGWAVSGRVINKADAAIVSVKKTPGQAPGEPVISAERGWPQCGCFYQQRLIIGGFRSLPNAWMASRQADYFNYDNRFTEANGPFLVPMDISGGEKIEALVPSLNLQIFTTQAEYWLAERALSKSEAPNHVQASRNGSRRGIPVAENEGASLWCHANGSTLGELRYTDQDGNYLATNISLLAPHLLEDVRDMAVRRATASMDGNVGCVIRKDGQARLVTLLREQEVTAFARMSSDGLFKAVARNGRNELSFILDHAGTRTLERMENGLLLDEAIDVTFGAPQATVPGLSRFNGRQIWAIGDRNVFGPFTVIAGQISLPVKVSHVTVGTWRPPIVSTLPPPREIGPNTVLKRKARIHTVHVSVLDTTSLAISTNGGPMKEVDLHRWGVAADVPELDQGVTTSIKISGLRGYADAPFVTISQLRPGRLNVRAITVEAAL
ncbi:hypothetical protein [Agrobacterium larrymoorei]|uniref:DUF4815 domain-containing protein n=1 Tax=Agrobacterium larrymoorei TaxID=160699 RepID=A0ABU0ULU7_9HYPH|nr:hypothetical protein [Agrobacterium larrymoorei]MDQ1185935.1 hypothetical protein [Agrobacterium larrymoorei]